MLIGLPIDVVVEATGSPEAATVHADAAIKNGRHVVMVSKEADIVVGPLFHRRAKAAGLVYTPVDGDQPCLLMQLIVWARVLGLEILCAGKTSEYDFVYDRAAGTGHKPGPRHGRPRVRPAMGPRKPGYPKPGRCAVRRP